MRADSPSEKMVMGGYNAPRCRNFAHNFNRMSNLPEQLFEYRSFATHCPSLSKNAHCSKVDNRAEGAVNGSYSVALKLYSGFMTSMTFTASPIGPRMSDAAL